MAQIPTGIKEVVLRSQGISMNVRKYYTIKETSEVRPTENQVNQLIGSQQWPYLKPVYRRIRG